MSGAERPLNAMEGGGGVADKAEFKECLRLTWSQPYILRLVFSAGIGGLLFGYDTGMNKYNAIGHKIYASLVFIFTSQSTPLKFMFLLYA
jgi:hypothetical protein